MRQHSDSRLAALVVILVLALLRLDVPWLGVLPWLRVLLVLWVRCRGSWVALWWRARVIRRRIDRPWSSAVGRGGSWRRSSVAIDGIRGSNFATKVCRGSIGLGEGCDSLGAVVEHPAEDGVELWLGDNPCLLVEEEADEGRVENREEDPAEERQQEQNDEEDAKSRDDRVCVRVWDGVDV